MPLHLIKLSVGTESPDSLEAFQAQRLKDRGVLFHQTRMYPRREKELLDGGSIYWIIKGQIRARQRILELRRVETADGRGATWIVLDPVLVRTRPRPHRAFQGWRYLKPEDAPEDLREGEGELENMPEEMRRELADLGLL